jgi:hypothetical protein
MTNKIKRVVLTGNSDNATVIAAANVLLAEIDVEVGEVTSYNEYLDEDSYEFMITITYKV